MNERALIVLFLQKYVSTIATISIPSTILLEPFDPQQYSRRIANLAQRRNHFQSGGGTGLVGGFSRDRLLGLKADGSFAHVKRRLCFRCIEAAFQCELRPRAARVGG